MTLISLHVDYFPPHSSYDYCVMVPQCSQLLLVIFEKLLAFQEGLLECDIRKGKEIA